MMIRTEQLCRTFGKVKAVDHVDLVVEKGSIYGLVGPNGAGKSTTMQILATLISPTFGRAWVDGLDVVWRAEEVRMRIGYMPDFFGVYDNLNAVEYLEFYAACYGIRRDRRRKIAFELLERVNLAAKAEEDVDRLSRGMKQRLGLARALVHDPDLLILDEPASGLDPKARVEMRDILKELRDSGKTVLISSHILPELADLCDAIGVMENGRLVASGSVAEIAARLDRGKRLVIEVLTEAERAEAWLRESPHVVSVERENRILSVRFIGSDQEQVELLAGLVGQNIAVKRFSEEVTDLENVFLQIMQATEGGTKDGASEPVVE